MSPRPTSPADRSVPIDALRGWALAGIAVVNVPWIGFRESLPSLLWYERSRAALPWWDVAAAGLVEALFEGRFYPIFSALFGLGTGILLARGAALHARRIAVLFVFGALHASLGWYGDVLLNYAAAGVWLGLLGRLRARSLFAIAAALAVLTQIASLRFDPWFAPEEQSYAEHLAYAERELRIYRDGTFVEITRHRLHELLGYFTAPWNVSYRLNVLTMATLGLAVERTGAHARIAALRPPMARWAGVLFGAGLLLSAASVVAPALYIVAGDVLACGYALAFLWLASAPGAIRWARPLAAIGRTALSAYLLQTLCFTFFFYGYGLGMYGRLGPLQGIALALAVYAGEIVLATLWLRRFEHGPIEWLWRALSYGRASRMRRSARVS